MSSPAHGVASGCCTSAPALVAVATADRGRDTAVSHGAQHVGANRRLCGVECSTGRGGAVPRWPSDASHRDAA